MASHLEQPIIGLPYSPGAPLFFYDLTLFFSSWFRLWIHYHPLWPTIIHLDHIFSAATNCFSPPMGLFIFIWLPPILAHFRPFLSTNYLLGRSEDQMQINLRSWRPFVWYDHTIDGHLIHPRCESGRELKERAMTYEN